VATSNAPAAGLDTSVVLRLLTGEPPRQAKRALNFLHQLHEEQRRPMVSDLVVAEAYYALHAHYGVPKREAIETLRLFVDSGTMDIEPGGCAARALEAAATKSSSPGFADRLIHAQYHRHGAEVASFETAFRKLPGTLVLKP
jgi:predicted nucleic acid-binding protein